MKTLKNESVNKLRIMITNKRKELQSYENHE